MDHALRRVSLPRLLAIVSFGFAITLLANTLEPAVLGHKVLELAPKNPNTAMGLTTFAGLLVATVVQPVVGYLSDRTRSRWGRRLPYLAVGTLLVLLACYTIATAPVFGLVVAGMLILQLGANTVQGPWQALIPDLVPQEQRGQASGLKAMLDIVALIVGRQAAGQLVARAPDWGTTAELAAVAVPAVAFVLALIVAARTLPDHPHAPAPAPATLREVLAGSFRADFSRYPAFRWWLVHRFLFWSAFILLNTFLLFFLIEVINLDEAQAQRFMARIFTVLGMALAGVSLPTGWLADRIGRKPLVVLSSVIAGSGTLVLLLARDVTTLTVAGAIIGVGIGIFMTASWALVTDIVPSTEAARYLGIANMAAAGGSALARFLGGALIDPLNRLLSYPGAGYLVMFGVAAAFFWLSTLAAIRLPAQRRSSSMANL